MKKSLKIGDFTFIVRSLGKLEDMTIEAVNLKRVISKPMICVQCVMDTTDSQITFNEKGVCSHCQSYEAMVPAWNLSSHLEQKSLEKLFDRIKKSGVGKEYDCLIGLSGGVDSSYLAYLVYKAGLRPLCIHLDNGWNSELAVRNIHNIVKKCNFDLHTHVLDWEEFRDLQVAFFKSNVIDLEMLSDHAIFGITVQLAKKYKIKNVLSGANISTEFVMPKSWVHRKQDLKNIVSIHQKLGEVPLKTFPQVSTLNHVMMTEVWGYQTHKPLNLIDYNKQQAKQTVIDEFGWRDYGGKHYESQFTKYYQAHILPKKFNVDKRKAHLSTLILSQQMTRAEALAELEKPLYLEADLKSDTEYVCKKLGFSLEWMEAYLKTPGVSHLSYG
ncbi:MAG: N-acetyl sugar amidotransferase, partial [Pseudobdellovibrionaceae bacterium]